MSTPFYISVAINIEPSVFIFNIIWLQVKANQIAETSAFHSTINFHFKIIHPKIMLQHWMSDFCLPKLGSSSVGTFTHSTVFPWLKQDAIKDRNILKYTLRLNHRRMQSLISVFAFYALDYHSSSRVTDFNLLLSSMHAGSCQQKWQDLGRLSDFSDTSIQ